MIGPTLIGGGLVLLFLGALTYLAGRPITGQKSTPGERSDVVAGKGLLATGALVLFLGVVWTVYEFIF